MVSHISSTTSSREMDPARPYHKLLRRRRRTNPLVWLAAILCTFFAIALIVVGLAILFIYLIYQPRIPYIKVPDAHLNRFELDQNGFLSTQVVVTMMAENDNRRAHATVSDFDFIVTFYRMEVAELKADPFEVEKNSTVALAYLVQSEGVPLGEERTEEASAALAKDLVTFGITGKARVRWRIRVLASLKFWTYMSCNLVFSYTNGSSLGLDCNSKSR